MQEMEGRFKCDCGSGGSGDRPRPVTLPLGMVLVPSAVSGVPWLRQSGKKARPGELPSTQYGEW